MAVSRFLIPALFAAGLAAQQTPPPAEQPDTQVFRTTVDVVVAPVTVTKDGDYVNGLQPNQFHLYDNSKEQNIQVDVSYQPISLVIAIQANDHVEAILPQIQKVGTLIQPMLIGDQGEAAVLAFDHRMRLMQEFTTDATKVTEAIKKIHAGSSTSAMVDAVTEATRMLRNRPQNRRRIILLISETRDRGSTGRARETLINAQLNNIILYSVDVSRFETTLTAKAQPPRPDPLPPAARQGTMPMGVPATPTTVFQTTQAGARMEFVPMMVEVFRDIKSIFIDNPVEFFTKGTGGAEYSFYRQKGLEDAIAKMGAELHSQYLISYNPNNKDEGGFHEIEVTIAGLRGAKVRTRPGYWLATKQ